VISRDTYPDRVEGLLEVHEEGGLVGVDEVRVVHEPEMKE
jgi:hypothetical protein